MDYSNFTKPKFWGNIAAACLMLGVLFVRGIIYGRSLFFTIVCGIFVVSFAATTVMNWQNLRKFDKLDNRQ